MEQPSSDGGVEAVGQLVSGDDAEFVIDAKDQYGNHLDTIETFTFDVFQVARDGVDASDPPKMAFTSSTLEYDVPRKLLTGRIMQVRRNGCYTITSSHVSLFFGMIRYALFETEYITHIHAYNCVPVEL